MPDANAHTPPATAAETDTQAATNQAAASAQETVQFWHRLSAPQINALAAEGVTILPIGSTEQHGPHLVTGTDTMLNDLLQRELVARPPQQGRFLLLPTLPLGTSEHHVPFGGTFTIPPLLYTQVLVESLRSLIRQGHKRIFVLNSHGGNQSPLSTALAELGQEATQAQVLLAGASYWAFCTERWQREMPELKLPRVGHACEVETSMMMAGYPELGLCIDATDPGLQAGNAFPQFLLEGWGIAGNYPSLSANGFIGYPAEASAAKGEKLLRIAAEQLAEFLARFATYPLTRDLRDLRDPQ